MRLFRQRGTPEIPLPEQRVADFMMGIKKLRSREHSPAFNEIWHNFGELATIPRPSTQEGEVSNWIMRKGTDLRNRGLVSHVEQGAENNVIIDIPASAGLEGDEHAIIVQVHMDMVVDFKNGAPDPGKEGVYPEVSQDSSGSIVQSKKRKTTLGADNGIGVATALALPNLLKDRSHGRIRLLFTTNEEGTNPDKAGMTGARAVRGEWLRGYSKLINFDSEEEQFITTGSAGVCDAKIGLGNLQREDAPQHLVYREIRVSGLEGGHSGATIGDKSRQNAIKLATEIAQSANSVQIVSLDSHGPHNAIPTEAVFVVGVPQSDLHLLEERIREMRRGEVLRKEKRDASVSLVRVDRPDSILTQESSKRVLKMLQEVPHGVLQAVPVEDGGAQVLIKVMNRTRPQHPVEETRNMPIQTATNLATVSLNATDTRMEIGMFSRSLTLEGLRQIGLDGIGEIVRGLGGEFSYAEEDITPPWKATTNELSNQIAQMYQQLYAGRPQMIPVSTLGGLETSIFGVNDMVAIGPDIFGAHTTDERITIASLERMVSVLLGVLEVNVDRRRTLV